MSSIDNNLLQHCKKLILEILPHAQLILYGSRARGDARDDSDYDLLILIDEPVNWQVERLIGNKLYDLELETGKLLSLQFISLRNWDSPTYQAMPFRKNVELEGIRI